MTNGLILRLVMGPFLRPPGVLAIGGVHRDLFVNSINLYIFNDKFWRI